MGCNLNDFLLDKNVEGSNWWVRVIDISLKVWEQELGEGVMRQLFLEYDKNKEF